MHLMMDFWVRMKIWSLTLISLISNCALFWPDSERFWISIIMLIFAIITVTAELLLHSDCNGFSSCCYHLFLFAQYSPYFANYLYFFEENLMMFFFVEILFLVPNDVFIFIRFLELYSWLQPHLFEDRCVLSILPFHPE